MELAHCIIHCYIAQILAASYSPFTPLTSRCNTSCTRGGRRRRGACITADAHTHPGYSGCQIQL